VRLECLWVYIACEVTVLVSLRCLWGYSACEFTLLVRLQCLRNCTACEVRVLVRLHCLWVYDACEVTVLVRLHCLWVYGACEVTVLVRLQCSSTQRIITPFFGFPLDGRLHTGYVRYIKSICYRQNTVSTVRTHCSQGTAKLYVAKYCTTIPAIASCIWSWQ
jgi:hypothetical protein